MQVHCPTHVESGLLCLVGLRAFSKDGERQITVGALRSVYLVKFRDSLGTCFNLAVDNKHYLVTAAHVVKGIKPGDTIGIYTSAGKWNEVAVSLIRNASSQIDIAILIPEHPISEPDFAVEVGTMANITQEVYFLGFPYGGKRVLGTRTFRLSSTFEGSPYPAPLVKRGIVSGVDNSDPSSIIIYIDAMNNPGFSGGPVLVYDSAAKISKVIGVVSGRVPEELMTPEGVPAPPVGANSGIVISHDIKAAVMSIRAR